MMNASVVVSVARMASGKQRIRMIGGSKRCNGLIHSNGILILFSFSACYGCSCVSI
jgi:hypothetical protein